MKKHLYIVLVGLLGFTSCDKYLDVEQKSSFTDDIIYSDPTLAEGEIMGIYYVMNEDRSYRNRLATYMGVNTDIEYKSSSKTGNVDNNRRSIATYCATPALGENFNDEKNPWSWLYTAIERCNLAITGITKYGNPEPGNTMGYLLGEALTLRAMFYYDLIRWWGDVPARFEPANESNIYLPKTDRADIYDQIIDDLAEASALMPWGGDIAQTSTVQRPNKAVAKGLRARIALSASGMALLSRNGGVVDFVMSSDARRQELHQIAKDECADIIASGRYRLESNFAQIFKDNCAKVVTNGRESIFEIPFTTSRGQWLSYLGLPAIGGTKWAATAVKGEILVMPTFFYDYNQYDKRRDVTVVPWRWLLDNGRTAQSLFTATDKKSTGINGMSLGKWRAEWMSTRMTSNDDGVNPIILRYADVLLMYAEADYCLANPDLDEVAQYSGAGLSYFNEVRERAYGDNSHNVNYIVYDDIRKERAFEFCGELLRKQDLIRWGLLKQNLDDALEALGDLKNHRGAYANVPQQVYYKLGTDAANNVDTLALYGFNVGEEAPAPAGYTVVQTAGSVDPGWLNKISIDVLYYGDPNKRQLMPIMKVILDGSQGTLKNDYGYE